jgi:protein phosphatase 1D
VHLSGTTASVVIFKNGKIYIGHVGDSFVVLDYQREGKLLWRGQRLTKDHKPQCQEKARIVKSDGRVVRKAVVPRVVWNRPRISFGDGDSVRILTDHDEIPFLAFTRSLGALWSNNEKVGKSVVSAEPDVMGIPVEVERNRCLILGTHGLWEVLSPKHAVFAVQEEECHNSELKVTQEHIRKNASIHLKA